MDTHGVTPLRSIRDESEEAEKESEITVDSLRDALAKEKVVGKHYKRIRRDGGCGGGLGEGEKEREKEEEGEGTGVADWDVFGQTVRSFRGYFVVDRQGGDAVKQAKEET